MFLEQLEQIAVTQDVHFMTVKRRKDNGAWEVCVARPGTKKLIRKSSLDWSRAEAIAYEQRLLAQEHSLEEALDRWLAEYVPFLRKPKTYENRAKQLRPFLVGKAIEDAPNAAAEVRRAMSTKAPATINRMLSMLRRVCHLAFKVWGWIEKPVGQKILMLTENNERHYYLTREEVERLRQHCTLAEAGNLLVFAAFTGLRKSEMFALNQSNVRGESLYLTARTKNGRPRVIPLHPRALAIAKQLPYKNITPNILRKQFENAREECGMEHINWHDLRHTFASWLIQKNTPLQVVKELMGHANIGMTMRYAHLEIENLKTAVHAL